MSADKPDDTRTGDRDFAALWSSDEATRSFSPGSTDVPVDLPYLFSPNQRFGPYLIVRQLGKGGMGQVYETEELESGRRVAIKLLGRGLGDEEERERFLSEGRLAASLSHPHCVYVYGTSEVQGFPVIAMELVPEGTLKERVVPDSPMPISAAVDAVLQVIAGLEAAAAIGILHRDIKPSNCFVHRDGRVLVGDFGLSVAAAHARGEKATGTILGTPGFASPEQLRGNPLDVRSDIYSVGATLFYLLAGRAPFEDKTTTSLIARVATEPPPSLETVRPGVPRRLALVVTKCLAKSPADRYDGYTSLGAALEAFGSARAVRGPLWRRAVAGAIDNWLTDIPAALVVAAFALQPLSPSHRLHALVAALVIVCSRAIYYGVCEGLWGAGAGKALMGLRVVDADLVTPDVSRSLKRAVLFALVYQIVSDAITWPIVRRVPDVSIGFLNTVTELACVFVLFCTVRRSNGYEAVHDRLTRTRVVRRRVRMEARARAERVETIEAAPMTGDARVGPFVVPAETPARVDAPVSTIGFDDRLKRRVWIDRLPAGTPPLDASRRDLDRPGRIRWLGGRRDGADCWDAYEAVDGQSLRDAVIMPQRWSRVRHWLDDLAREIAAGLGDGSLPRLHPDRVWIGRDDRARLLEWASPGSGPIQEPPGSAEPTLVSAQHLLHATAIAALLGVPGEGADTRQPATPLPRAARDLLLKLRDATFTSPDAMLAGLGTALSSPAHFSRIKRAGQIAVSAALPVLVTIITVAAQLGTSAKRATLKGGLLFTAFAVYSGTFVVPMFFSAIGAMITGSGFTFRPFGAMLVNKRGKRASRVRALWRAVVTWSPVVATLGLYAFQPHASSPRPSVVALQCAVMLGMTAAALWSIARPTRGVQDRLSGTWIVPR